MVTRKIGIRVFICFLLDVSFGCFFQQNYIDEPKKGWKWFSFTTRWWFHPYLGKISILTNIFQRGWNHQLDQSSHSFTSNICQDQLPLPRRLLRCQIRSRNWRTRSPEKTCRSRNFFQHEHFQQFEISMFNLGAWDETTFFPKWFAGVFWSLVEWPWCSQMSSNQNMEVEIFESCTTLRGKSDDFQMLSFSESCRHLPRVWLKVKKVAPKSLADDVFLLKKLQKWGVTSWHGKLYF